MTLPVPARILVVGGGGREHALAWRLAAEPGVEEVVVAPGSAGIAQEPGVRCVPVDPLDPAAVTALARAEAVDLVVIGPEAPLAAGVADMLDGAGIPVFGPGREAARPRDVQGVLPRGRGGGRRADGAIACVRGRRRAGGRRVHPRAGATRATGPSSRPTGSPPARA